MNTLNTVITTIEQPKSVSILSDLEQHKMFIGIIGIIVFLTGRSLYNELYEYCNNEINILEYHYIKKITLWCVLFLYTRSIFYSTLLGIMIILAFPMIFFTDIFISNESKEISLETENSN